MIIPKSSVSLLDELAILTHCVDVAISCVAHGRRISPINWWGLSSTGPRAGTLPSIPSGTYLRVSPCSDLEVTLVSASHGPTFRSVDCRSALGRGLLPLHQFQQERYRPLHSRRRQQLPLRYRR